MDADKDDEATASATPQLIPSSSSCSSTSSCSCDDDALKEAEVFLELRRRTTTEEKEEGYDQEKDREEATGSSTRGGVSDNDVDDGYHTPTSPEHRIPASSECPLAPKKSSRFQYSKRKSMAGGPAGWSSSSVRREIVFDLSVELDGCLQKNKKARREAAIAK